MHALEIRDGALVPCRLPVPVAAPGEQLIRVAYVGVNRADILQIAGDYAPPAGASPLPGLEVSGWLASGANAGDAVCALLSGGGYAEYVTAPAGQVLPLPPGIDLKQAASLPEAAATSAMALGDAGHLHPGERVLIHGGSSGVGILMVQYAKLLGAEVFATVGSAEKQSFLETFGVHALNYRTAPFADQLLAATGGDGVDLIIDTLGGPQFATHLRLLRRGGRLVSLAMLEGSALPAETKMTRILMNHLNICGATLRSRTPVEKAALMAQVQAFLWPALANGGVRPVIDSVFALADAKKALLRMQERLHMGKILLEVTAN